MLTEGEKIKWFRRIKKSSIRKKDNLILQYCNGKSILDVGCVGQDRSYNSENWLHNRIRMVAKSVTGVDIEKKGIDALKAKGFKILHISELEQLGTKFDVILLADVIEHVNNPVDILTYYKQYLLPDGIFIISTPNATRLRTFVEIFTTTTYSMNLEHNFWFCPKTMLEVFNRADIVPVEFYWVEEYISKIRYMILKPILKIWKNFNSNFLFICKNEQKS